MPHYEAIGPLTLNGAPLMDTSIPPPRRQLTHIVPTMVKLCMALEYGVDFSKTYVNEDDAS
jgi:hypothetical protein